MAANSAHNGRHREGNKNARPEYHYKVVSRDSPELDNCRMIDSIDSSMAYHIGRPEVIGTSGTCLRYPYGGKSLDKLNLSMHLDYIRFLRGFVTIFEGVVHMNSLHFYHLDIKMSNITMTDDYVFRFIDFGISGSNRIRTIFANVYVIWPYETCLLARAPPQLADERTRLDTYVSDPYFKHYCPYTDESAIAERINDNYQKLKVLPMDERLDIIYNKIDIYSLAIVLDSIIGILDLPERLAQALRGLCLAMMDFSTEHRCTAQWALRRYKTIINCM